MPLWLDLLKTPMAAPETPELRSMRRTFQLLCVLSAVGVIAISPLTNLLGRIAPLMVGAILLTSAFYTALYALLKNRADEAFLADALAISSDVRPVMPDRVGEAVPQADRKDGQP